MGIQFTNRNLQLLQSYTNILKNHSEITINHTLYEAMKKDEESETQKIKVINTSVMASERSGGKN